MNGDGILILSDSTYEGSFKNGLFDGFGIQTWEDGRMYSGSWKKGLMDGCGVYYLAFKDTSKTKRDMYVGTFVEGVADGCGCWVWSDGSVYMGELKRQKRHGQGQHTFIDGSVFAGEWKEDRFHGLGCRTWSDGSSLEGDYRANLIHGFGVFTCVSGGVTYRGRYQMGKRDGLGSFCYVDGTRYLGEVAENEKNGFGAQREADNTKKEGKWKNGKYLEPKLFNFDGDMARQRAREALAVAQEAQNVTAFARGKFLLYQKGLLAEQGRLGNEIGRMMTRDVKRLKQLPPSMSFLLSGRPDITWVIFYYHWIFLFLFYIIL
jgi:hypothetical protein